MRETRVFSPYELVIREIEIGSLDPFDINLGYLIELFRKEAEDLKEWEYFEEAGRFLEASTKLIKLQVEGIFPKPKPERKKITIKEVRDVLVGNEDACESEYDLSWLWEHEVKVGRPARSKGMQERTPAWRELWTQVENIPVHRTTDYCKFSERIRHLIKEDKFCIRTLTDFIAYLHAYMEYEDIPELRDFVLKETTCTQKCFRWKT